MLNTDTGSRNPTVMKRINKAFFRYFTYSRPTITKRVLTQNLYLKRILDISLAAIAIASLSPLFLVIAAHIKINSKGPIFFLQKRIGLHNRPFHIIKFRTLEYIFCENSGDKTFHIPPEHLIKRGAFLRKTHLDELPQLFNIFLGSMSFVGPRPYTKFMTLSDGTSLDSLKNFSVRTSVKPGLTGLAQSMGHHGPMTDIGLAQQRLDYDLEYIQQASFLLDFKIIWRTLFKL